MITFTPFAREALAAAAAGLTKIFFTAVKTSDTGVLTTDEYPDFTSIKQTTSPTRVDFDKVTNTAVVAAGFTNTGLGAPYTIKAVGIYCVCAGEYETHTSRLFAYETFNDPMPLPSEAPISYTYSFNTTISDTEAVGIIIDTGTYALASDLRALELDYIENKTMYKDVQCNDLSPDIDPPFNYSKTVLWEGCSPKDCFIAYKALGTDYRGVFRITPTTGSITLSFLTKPYSDTIYRIYRLPATSI